jgi:hypothetical protein
VLPTPRKAARPQRGFSPQNPAGWRGWHAARAMEQHPVPQQISAYEFELVGDMTIKQFAFVAAGVIIALIFYASGLPAYFKWPAIVIAGVTGILMAFVPLQERPLQTWIIAFLKAVYSPTQFLWEKKTKIPEFLILKPVPKVVEKVPVAPKVAAGRLKLTEYLTTLPSQPTPLDQQEGERLKNLDSLFLSVQLPSTLTPKVTPLAKRKMPAGVKLRRTYGPLVVEEEGRFIRRGLEPEVTPQPKKPKPEFKPKIIQPLKREKKATTPVKFSEEITLPSTPTMANVLVGMVLGPDGKIIEGAIMEIRDQEGNPVRALKTNKLGHFQIVTPLANGTYEIETEKEGYQFDIIKVTLVGKIVPPIEIRARGVRAQMEN